MGKYGNLNSMHSFHKTDSEKLKKWIMVKCKIKGMSQSDLGKKLGFSQQAVSYKVNNGSFTFYELKCIFSILGATDDEIISLMSN